MINIRRVSDLRDKYSEIEELENELEEAEKEATNPNTRYYTHEEMKELARRK